MALHPTQPLVITGDLGGKVYVSNFVSGEPGSVMPNPHADSVESVAFCGSEIAPYCVSCGLDSKLNIYDFSAANSTLR